MSRTNRLALPTRPNVIEAAAVAAGSRASSFLDDARRVADLVETIERQWLTCTHCHHEHRAGPCVRPVEQGFCGCDRFEPEASDEEVAEIKRLLRDPQPVEWAIGARETLERQLLPLEFRDVTFESFAPKTPSQVLARKTAKRFVERLDEGQKTLLAFVGDTGRGKSHLLYAALRETIAWGAGKVPIYSRPWYTLAHELRYGGTCPYTGRALEAHEVRQAMRAARVVFIDEIRWTAGTEFDTTELANFACFANDNGVSVFVTTNASPIELVVGPAFASRFTVVTLDGPDHRQTRPRDHQRAAAGERED